MAIEQDLERRLCLAGDPAEHIWPANSVLYVEACGLTESDTPELAEIASFWPRIDWSRDSQTEFDVGVEWDARFLPIAAWRALGELRAESAVQPLLAILVEFGARFDEWLCEDLPHVFAMMGPAVSHELMAFIDSGDAPDLPREIAVMGLCEIAREHPESRESLFAYLTGLVADPERHSIEFITAVVGELADQQVVSAAEAIERAYAADRIDTRMIGRWERVRENLGVEGIGLEMPTEPYDSLDNIGIADLGSLAEQLQFSGDDSDDYGAEDYGAEEYYDAPTPAVADVKVGRNEPCPCGSGKKYKKCCLPAERSA